jgi:hypothetical protein
MVVALPGEQRSVFAHAPTIWRTVHANPTNERDLAKLEAMLIADDYEALDLRLSAAEVPA